jgi:hypothetical protein
LSRDRWHIINLQHVANDTDLLELFPVSRFPDVPHVFANGDPLRGYPNYDQNAKDEKIRPQRASFPLQIRNVSSPSLDSEVAPSTPSASVKWSQSLRSEDGDPQEEQEERAASNYLRRIGADASEDANANEPVGFQTLMSDQISGNARVYYKRNNAIRETIRATDAETGWLADAGSAVKKQKFGNELNLAFPCVESDVTIEHRLLAMNYFHYKSTSQVTLHDVQDVMGRLTSTSSSSNDMEHPSVRRGCARTPCPAKASPTSADVNFEKRKQEIPSVPKPTSSLKNSL